MNCKLEIVKIITEDKLLIDYIKQFHICVSYIKGERSIFHNGKVCDKEKYTPIKAQYEKLIGERFQILYGDLFAGWKITFLGCYGDRNVYYIVVKNPNF